jgi:hypothetical protein
MQSTKYVQGGNEMQKAPTSLRLLFILSWSWFVIVALLAATVIIPSFTLPYHRVRTVIIAILVFFTLLQFFTAFFLQKRQAFAPKLAFFTSVLFMTTLFMARLFIALPALFLNIAIIVLILVNWPRFLPQQDLSANHDTLAK